MNGAGGWSSRPSRAPGGSRFHFTPDCGCQEGCGGDFGLIQRWRTALNLSDIVLQQVIPHHPRCSCLLSCALVFSGITQIGVYGLWPPVEATRGQLEHTCKCAAFTAPHSVKIDVVLVLFSDSPPPLGPTTLPSHTHTHVYRAISTSSHEDLPPPPTKRPPPLFAAPSGPAREGRARALPEALCVRRRHLHTAAAHVHSAGSAYAEDVCYAIKCRIACTTSNPSPS